MLTLFVLREQIKGEKSFWKPYLDTIEKSSCLLDWNGEELGELENENLIGEVY